MGRAPCCDKANVKKGPWSPEEDAKLKSYIDNHGTGGNWIALPQKIGLKRCGKSCRLRWLNYLRPNIKHGGFTEDEDNLICSLYLSIGSRWSIMAAQLPGRTDNDIKNYWNTRLKKKLLGNNNKQQQRREQAQLAGAKQPGSAAETSYSYYSNIINNHYYCFSQLAAGYDQLVDEPPAANSNSLANNIDLVMMPRFEAKSSISNNLHHQLGQNCVYDDDDDDVISCAHHHHQQQQQQYLCKNNIDEIAAAHVDEYFPGFDGIRNTPGGGLNSFSAVDLVNCGTIISSPENNYVNWGDNYDDIINKSYCVYPSPLNNIISN